MAAPDACVPLERELPVGDRLLLAVDLASEPRLLVSNLNAQGPKFRLLALGRRYLPYCLNEALDPGLSFTVSQKSLRFKEPLVYDLRFYANP